MSLHLSVYRQNNETLSLFAFSCLHLLGFFRVSGQTSHVRLGVVRLGYAQLQVHIEMNLVFLAHPPLCTSLLCYSSYFHPRSRSPCSSLAKRAGSERLSRSICADVADKAYHVCWSGERWGSGRGSGNSLSLVTPTVTIDFGRNAGD